MKKATWIQVKWRCMDLSHDRIPWVNKDGRVIINYLSASSLTVRCGAKHAIAHTLISTPVKNCFPLMSQTPWFGIACCLVCSTLQPWNSCSFSKVRNRSQLHFISYCSMYNTHTSTKIFSTIKQFNNKNNT